MLRYTYTTSIQGNGTSHYIDILFNRVLSTKSVYRTGILRKGASFTAGKIMDGIAKVRGVVSGSKGNPYLADSNESELININGARVTVHIAAITTAERRAIVQAIVKRVQRLIAPNESRKCIGLKQLRAEVEKENRRLA